MRHLDVRCTMTRIVIADDDEDIRALMAIAAHKAGLDVVASCPDGDEAWSAIQDARPDIALLDVAMPGHTGVELSRMIKASAFAGAYIVLLSAAVSPRDQKIGLEAGADEYLVKPFSPRVLGTRLAQIAGSLTA